MTTNCAWHADRAAVSDGSRCGVAVCEECGEVLGDEVLCPRCAREEQPTAVLPQSVAEPPVPGDYRAPVARARPSARAAAAPASYQTLVGAVAVLGVLLLGALIIIGVLLARPGGPTGATAPVVQPSDQGLSETMPTVPPVASEPSATTLEPTQDMAIAACRQHFPTEDYVVKIGKHTADWYFATGYVGPSATDLQYQLDLEWNGKKYEVASVTPVAPAHAKPTTPIAPTTGTGGTEKRPVDVVADDPRFSTIEGAKYTETANDGRRATVEITTEVGQPQPITVRLEKQGGKWVIVGGTE